MPLSVAGGDKSDSSESPSKASGTNSDGVAGGSASGSSANGGSEAGATVAEIEKLLNDQESLQRSSRSSRRLGVVQTVYQGVVMKYPKRKKTFPKPRCRNMVLTNQPRLYFTSTEQVDGKEGMYLSDIILYKQLKISMNRSKDTLVI